MIGNKERGNLETTVPPAKHVLVSRRVLDLDFFSRILDGGSGMDGSSGLWILGKNFQSDFKFNVGLSGFRIWFGFSFGRSDFKERFSIGISSSFGLRIFWFLWILLSTFIVSIAKQK